MVDVQEDVRDISTERTSCASSEIYDTFLGSASIHAPAPRRRWEQDYSHTFNR